MNCPWCSEPIPETLLKKWWASLGGRSSKREITSEQQAKMQAGRKASLSIGDVVCKSEQRHEYEINKGE